jgi:ferredoxin
MASRFIDEGSLKRWVAHLAAGEFWASVRVGKNGEHGDLARITPETVDRLDLRSPRPIASIKSFLMPVREKVATYSKQGPAGEDLPAPKQQVVMGLRSCDLRAIHILDQVFLEGDFQDPFYKQRRENLVLISTDCRTTNESCFCALLDEEAFSETGFDLNLAPIEGGYVLTVGSEKGQKLLDETPDLFKTEATDEQLKQVDTERQTVKDRLTGQVAPFRPGKPIRELLADQHDWKAWQKVVADCVECGACTNVCPTCHCFFLFDQTDPKRQDYERVRSWDSCIYGDYSRMAGVGGMKPNPRADLKSRFVNRFEHKYLYFYHTYRMLGCTGCGRCVDACLGGIDPREVLRDLGKAPAGKAKTGSEK